MDTFPRLRILLIEDNATNRLVVTRLLERVGCEVEQAEDGLEGFELLGKRPYDVVFVDQQLPKLDGDELIRRVRSGEQGKGAAIVPMVMLSGNAPKCEESRQLASARVVHLMKPVTLAMLRSAIDAAIAHSKG